MNDKSTCVNSLNPQTAIFREKRTNGKFSVIKLIAVCVKNWKAARGSKYESVSWREHANSVPALCMKYGDAAILPQKSRADQFLKDWKHHGFFWKFQRLIFMIWIVCSRKQQKFGKKSLYFCEQQKIWKKITIFSWIWKKKKFDFVLFMVLFCRRLTCTHGICRKI